MAVSFIYNTVNFSELLTVKNIKGRAFSPSSVNVAPDIPQKPGTYFIEKTRGAREITVEVMVISDDLEGLRKKFEAVTGALDNDKEVPIEFSDEPDRVYYGIMVTDGGFDEVLRYGQGEITFYCSDPRKYGPEQSSTFANNELVVQNEGTAETDPVFEIEVTQDITHLDIVREDGEYMRIGRPAPIEQTPFEQQTLIFHDTCQSTVGWTTADEVDNGYVAGEISASDGFAPSLFGGAIQPYAWQGPSIKTSLPEAVTNYRIDIETEFLNVGTGTGMIEVYLKDASNNTIAKLGVEDIWRTTDKVQAKMKLGNVDDPEQVEYYTEADYNYGWNNFSGMMRLHSHNFTDNGTRRIRPYFAIVRPDGVHDWVRRWYLYKDVENRFGAPVTQIQVAFRVWAPETESAEMKIKDIKVWRYNDEPQGIPYLAKAGDTITIDHKYGDVLLNGESIKTEKDFGASFFDLPPGYTTLYSYPEGAFNTTMKWKPAYK